MEYAQIAIAFKWNRDLTESGKFCRADANITVTTFSQEFYFYKWERAMASVLGVHGIGQQLKGEELIANEWRRALRDGMRLAGAPAEDLPGDEDIEIAFYGDLFREKAAKGTDAPFELVDIEEGIEADLIKAWLVEAEIVYSSEKLKVGDAAYKSVWQRETVQQLALTLLRRRFFAALTERLFVGALKQVRRYFTESETRHSVRQRLATRLKADTRVRSFSRFDSSL